MSATQIPEDLSYTRSHEWVKMDGNVATIGITAYAQGELGDIVFVEVPEAGAAVRGDEPFGTIEAVKTVADLIAPASGQVVETNPALADHPELVNSDPYGAGWMIRLRLDGAAGPAGRSSASGYRPLREAA